MPLMRSWVGEANAPGISFPLNNLPYGVFSVEGGPRRCGVAIGSKILDVTALEAAGAIILPGGALFNDRAWNRVMAAGPAVWALLRQQLTELLAEGANGRAIVEPHLVPMATARLHMPLEVTEYTDFYASRNHAAAVGMMFRGVENALPLNWLHMPIGYNGRASSVIVSGTPVRRPWGQVKGPDQPTPSFQPSRRFDVELELVPRHSDLDRLNPGSK